MAKHTLKILGCSQTKILKYVWPFYNIMYEMIKMVSFNFEAWFQLIIDQ